MKDDLINKIAEDESGPLDMVNQDQGEEDFTEGLGDDIGGGDLGGGDMGGGEPGLGDDMGNEGMPGEQQPPMPDIDWDEYTIKRTHDLEDTIEDQDDMDIDFSRLV